VTTGRDVIGEALATVPGLIPTDTTPKAPTPGAAWPRWVQTTFAGKLHRVAVSAYDVLVVLPAGTNEITVESADGLMEDIATALMKIGTVESCQPVALTFDEGTTMPGLQFRCTPVVC
jgi:hypothetical protein